MKTLNNKLYYFNPGNETAVRSGNIHYTPKASGRKMMSDLALMPLWYGEKSDYILIDESIDSSVFFAQIPEAFMPLPYPVTRDSIGSLDFGKGIEAAPWGLSPQVIYYFNTLQQENHLLDVPLWKNEYTVLTSRQTAADCLKKIKHTFPEFRKLKIPQFCTNLSEINQFISTHSPPYIFKMPYSCSGRGLYWVHDQQLDKLAMQWISGVLKKQGMLSIEQALDKVLDFAMEFESDGLGGVYFKGLSVFDTLKKGAFNGNLLGSQQFLENILSEYISLEHIQSITKEIINILADRIGNSYSGYLGVDMIIYRDNRTFQIHPFIEINLRYTMGLVALELSRKLIHPDAHGRFHIEYNKNAYALHLEMQKEYPLKLKEEKILSGYFPLCPVNKETNYMAYIHL